MDKADESTERTPLLGSQDKAKDGSTTPTEKTPSKVSEEKYSLKFVTLCILFTELCERLTYYSINGNMVLFLTSVLMFSSPDAVTINLVFTGTCYFVPLVGGWMADSIAGKFNTIYGSTLIYFIGTALLPAAAVSYTSVFASQYEMDLTARRVFYLIGVSLVAVGTGGIKSNVGPFGAQQSEDSGPVAVQSFFNWFYWFIQIGAGIAYSLSAYVQQNVGFDIGYLIPVIAIFVALIVFSSGRNHYIHNTPSGSVFSSAAKIVIQGVKRRWNSSVKLDSFLDFAKRTYGGSFSEAEVNGVKGLGRTIPIYLCLIMFWTIYNQSSNTFLLQGERLNLNLGGFTFPAASLSLFNCIIVFVQIPLMDRFIYPCLKRINRSPTLMQRMGIGMLFSAAGALYAGVLEIVRKKDLQETGGIVQKLGGKEYTAATIGILWQVPQFLFIGAGEVFTVIASYEFAYTDAPVSMKGLVMGINMVTNGLGSYFGSLLVNICNAATPNDPWIPDEINKGHVENFFFLLTGLMILNFIIFIFLSKRYKPISAEADKHPLEIEVHYDNSVPNPSPQSAGPIIHSYESSQA